MKKSLVGLTASAALLGLMPGALHAASPMLSDGSKSSTAQKRAERLLADARQALARGVPASAVRQAEAAVKINPKDAQARSLLGRAYLAAGRFQSAETALGDALTLDPSMGRAAVGRALAQIALGQPDAAQQSLEAAEHGGVDADIGLALALLGHADEARERLLAAAREPGADARTRQNLALAYALEGRWNDAATVAAQDVPPELIADRLRRWAMVAQMKNDRAMQIGALLGVLPAADGGQPVELALALPTPESATAEPVKMAEVAPFELAVVVPPVVPVVQTDGDAAVTPTNFAAPSIEKLAEHSKPVIVTTEPLAPVAEVVKVAAAATKASVQAWAGPPRMRTREKPRIVEVKPPQRVVELRALRPERRVVTPKPILLVSRTMLKPVRGATPGSWSVQLGAYRSAARTEVAWAKLNTRVTFLNGHVPTGSKVKRGKALFHRLSVGGLPSRAEAIRLCIKVREAGGACFVRRSSGDQPLTWAMRKGAETA